MKIPPSMLGLFLRSAGAPDALIEVMNLIQQEGFGAFAYKVAPDNDPNWEALNMDPTRKQNGVYLRAEGPNSRVVVGIFMEGATDEFLSKIASIGVPAADSSVRV